MPAGKFDPNTYAFHLLVENLCQNQAEPQELIALTDWLEAANVE